MSLLLTALLAAAIPGDTAPPLALEGPSDEPAIQLWMNSGGAFKKGERVRVQVEPRDDGFLLVLRLDTDGRVHVLFPLDPRDDNFVRGGRRYEIRSDQDSYSFEADRGGEGLVLSAIAADPYQFDAITVGGAWDYGAIRVDPESRDPEADLTALVQRVTSDRGFDYDVLPYSVFSPDLYVENNNYYYPSAGCYPSIGYTSRCYDGYWPRGCIGCPAWYPGTGFFIGFGWWDDYFWDPYYGRYRYAPYGYRYGWYGYPYPYGGYGPITVGRRGPIPVIQGRPRGYTVGRLGQSPSSTRSRLGGGGDGRGGTGARGGSTPSSLGGRSRPRPSSAPAPKPVSQPAGGTSGTSSASPPRRSRPRPSGDTPRPAGGTQLTQERPNMDPGRTTRGDRGRVVMPVTRSQDVSPARRVRERELPRRVEAPVRSAQRESPPARRAREVEPRFASPSRTQRQATPSRTTRLEPRLERRNPPQPSTRRASPPPSPPKRPAARPAPPPPPPPPSSGSRSRSRGRPHS